MKCNFNTSKCWIETSVRCKGGRNQDGFYVLGSYATVSEGAAALKEHKTKHPSAFCFLVTPHDCPIGDLPS